MPEITRNDPDLTPGKTLVRVVAPQFTAQIVISSGRCIEAEPPLEWAIGKPRAYLSRCFMRRRWRATIQRKRKQPEPPKDLPTPAGLWPSSRVATSRAEAIVKGAAWRV